MSTVETKEKSHTNVDAFPAVAFVSAVLEETKGPREIRSQFSRYFSVRSALTTPTHGHFVLFPVSLASRDQDGGPSMIDTYNITEKIGDCEQSI